jgi:transposase
MARPEPDKKSIKKVLEFQKKGFTIYQIAKLMGKHRKTVWRWAYSYRGDLSPAKRGNSKT